MLMQSVLCSPFCAVRSVQSVLCSPFCAVRFVQSVLKAIPAGIFIDNRQHRLYAPFRRRTHLYYKPNLLSCHPEPLVILSNAKDLSAIRFFVASLLRMTRSCHPERSEGSSHVILRVPVILSAAKDLSAIRFFVASLLRMTRIVILQEYHQHHNRKPKYKCQRASVIILLQ